MSLLNELASTRIATKKNKEALKSVITNYDVVDTSDLVYDHGEIYQVPQSQLKKSTSNTLLWTFCYFVMVVETLLIINYGSNDLMGVLVLLFVWCCTHSAFKQMSVIPE